MPTSVKQYFAEAQLSGQNHEKFITELLQDDRQGGMESLCDEVIHCLKYVMVEYNPEPTVERLVKFSSKLIARANTDHCQVLFDEVMQFLVESHEANDKAVRYRACQLVAQTLDNLGDAELDDSLCSDISKAMQARLRDIVHVVRVQAVRALTRMQDPYDKRCPIVKAFITLMGSDANWQVRVECLRSVAPTKRSLLAMIGRTKDVNEIVRKTAYHVIAEKISVKALSISQRLRLLENGLADDSAQVKKACTEKLLQAWLAHYQADVLDLLGGLDVMSSGEVCEKSVNLLLFNAPIADVLEEFDLLDENQLIHTNRLSCESVFYYRVLLKHISELEEVSADVMEKIVPETKAFSQYIIEVTMKLADCEASDFDKAPIEYQLEQLIASIKYLDVTDPVSRKCVLSVCKDLLNSNHLSISLIPELVKCIKFVLTKSGEFLTEMGSIISDIQAPNVVEQQPVDPDTLHNLKLKLAKVTVNLNELSELLSEAVSKRDFASAAEFKEKIEQLEISKSSLTEQMAPQQMVVACQVRNDEATLLKCLTIFVELLVSCNFSSMSDTIRSYMEELVIPSIPDRCPAVRNQAIKALGLCCLCDQDVSRKFLPIFVQIFQLDCEAVRVSSLKAMLDIMLVHGVECFQNEKKSNELDKKTIEGSDDENKENCDNSNRPDEMFDTGNSKICSSDSTCSSSDTALRSANDLVQMFVDSLEDKSSLIQTVCAEGLTKLLLTRRVVSSHLLSRLILLWYNPITEGDIRLRHCLGDFFQDYSFASRDNQAQVEEAFLPTLQILFDAPRTSPLFDVDEDNVAELLIQLTNPRGVQKVSTDGAEHPMTAHDSMAICFCNEIIENENCYGVFTLCKALNLLELTHDNEILAKDLRNLSTQLIKGVKDKRALKQIGKFQTTVQRMNCVADSTKDIAGSEHVEDRSENNDSEMVNAAQDEEELGSDVLDTTPLNTSKLKRAANISCPTGMVLSDLTDRSDESDTLEKKDGRRRRKTKVPKFDDDSD